MRRTNKHYIFLKTERDKVCTSKHLWITKLNSSVGTLYFRYLVETDIKNLSEMHINGPTHNDEHLLRTAEKMALMVGLVSF